MEYIPAPTGTGGWGGLGGGGVGCNWQSRQWVLGIEGDFDAANITGSSTNSAFSPVVHSFGKEFGLGPNGFTGVNSTGTANERVLLHWLSTVRARAGFAVQDRILLYATGGLAIGGIDSNGSVTLSGGNPGWSGSNSAARVGAVLGGGAEWAFYNSWTVKAEYLWYDLGNVSHPLNCSQLCSNTYPTLGNASSSVFGSIVRVGINYNFGGPR